MFLWLVLAFLVVLPSLAPSPAFAYKFEEGNLGYDPVTGEFIDGQICPGVGLFRRLVPCIKETLINVTNEMLMPFSKFMRNAVVITCCIAVALLGALLIGAKTSAPFKDTTVLMVKIAAVSAFTMGFAGMFGLLLDTMDSLLDIVTSKIIFSGTFKDSVILNHCPEKALIDEVGAEASLRVWTAVDCALNSLIGGIFGEFTLTMGIIGFILSCLVSNTIGMMIGLMGVRLILQLMWALVRAMYIFLTSYIGVCLLVLVSPLFIPTILFQATRGYFERWLRILLSFMLQPVILFAYLAMLLTAFDLVIFSGPNSLYATIAGPTALEPNFLKPIDEGGRGGIGGWLMGDGGGYRKEYRSPVGVIINPEGAQKTANEMNKDNKAKDAGVDTGAGGMMSAMMTPTQQSNAGGVNINRRQNNPGNVLRDLGLGLKSANDKNPKLNFFEFSLPVDAVDWNVLASQNGVTISKPDDLVAYMIRVYVAFLMALITAYVFVEMLDTLPFIGSGLAMGSGIVDEKSMGMDGLAKMAPPGNDFMKNIRSKMFST